MRPYALPQSFVFCIPPFEPLPPYSSRLQELFSNCLAVGRATVVPSCGGSPHHFSHTICNCVNTNSCYSWQETIKRALTLEQLQQFSVPNVHNLHLRKVSDSEIICHINISVMRVNAHAFRVLISPGKVTSIQHAYLCFRYSTEREIR